MINQRGISAASTPPSGSLRLIPVEKIRPEDGLSRQRDRDGHLELQHSIQTFGVLTPITVRPAPGSGEEYLLVKGQGRTLACLLLGIKEIPAIVVNEEFTEAAKVQQFLAENIARLKMTPTDRAILIKKARASGEETANIARRFGLSPATVRRLLMQLDGASKSEVEALRSGQVTLSLHAVVAKNVIAEERGLVLDIFARNDTNARDAELILYSINWKTLSKMEPSYRIQRYRLLNWAAATLRECQLRRDLDRIEYLATHLPETLNAENERLAT